MKLLFKLFLGFLLIHLSAFNSYSQSLKDIQNKIPSNFNVNSLSDDDIISLYNKYNIGALSQEEVYSKLKLIGISEDAINQLYKRYNMIIAKSNNQNKTKTESLENVNEQPLINKRPRTSLLNLPIFGFNLFDPNDLNFEPEIRTQIPKSYTIKQKDFLQVEIYGLADFSYSFEVDANGEIRIPNLGLVKVGGLSINDCELKLKSQLKKIYPGIESNKTGLKVTLKKVGGVYVKVIGQVYYPGKYLISNFGTILNALTAAGGPNDFGSYRSISLLRNGKKICEFDVYLFILNGDMSQNLVLEDDDIILVNPYNNRIAFTGAVRFPAYYEVLKGETIENLLQFSGGLSYDAIKSYLKIIRYGDLLKEIISINKENYATFILQNGDNIAVDKIFNGFKNRVIIDGAVNNPGTYDINSNPTVYDLLVRVSTSPGAFLDKAKLFRKNKTTNLTEIVEFSPIKILQKKETMNLYPEDSLFINFYSDLNEEKTIQIIGEVNNPGVFKYFKGMLLSDIVLNANGFKLGASKYHIQISRRLIIENKYTSEYSSVMDFQFDSLNLNNQALNILLTPYDIIYIRSIPSFKPQKFVYIKGEVLYPGTYTLKSDSFRISDIIQEAGGLLPSSYLPGASILRLVKRQTYTSKPIDKLSNDIRLLYANKENNNEYNNPNDSSFFEDIDENAERSSIGIRLDEIMKNKNSKENIALIENDEVYIPKYDKTVQVSGAVNSPKKILYEPHLNFKKAVEFAGGFSYRASKKYSYVIYPNGEVRSTKHFLFFKIYPKIKPGSEILVLFKHSLNNLNIAQRLAIYSSITSFAILFISLISYLRSL